MHGTTSEPIESTFDREIVLTRVFAAPRAMVWKAWTDPEQLAKWWGPTGFTNPVCEIDVRPGGQIRIDMHAPNGIVYPMTGAFEEVVPPRRLVFTSAAMDSEGKPIFVNRNTVTFTEAADGTEIALHVKVISATANAQQYLKGMKQGWSLSLDRLAALLKAAS
jgi:uncharacterized protein YndB with AHSA1/START domain